MDEKQEMQLTALAQADAWYQQLLSQCQEAETAYLQLLDKLSDADRETPERYIALCEELEYRRTCLAITKMSR